MSRKTSKHAAKRPPLPALPSCSNVAAASSDCLFAMPRALLLILMLVACPALALQPVAVAPDVYAFIGSRGDVAPENGGNVGNSGFIVGSSGVIVIDTGASYAHGRAMLAAIRAVTTKPVKTVVITHAVQEYVFGASAFAEAGATLITHAKSAELMRSRCNRCLEGLKTVLGEQVMQGTRLLIPEHTVEGPQKLHAGGRDVELWYFGWASTPGDLVVYDPKSGVAFAGGMAMNERIPELRDGDLAGWLGALDRLAASPARILVPGRGPPGGIELARSTATYLRTLDAQVRRHYAANATLTQAVDDSPLPSYAGWDGYPDVHRRNVLHRFLQLETEELSR